MIMQAESLLLSAGLQHQVYKDGHSSSRA